MILNESEDRARTECNRGMKKMKANRDSVSWPENEGTGSETDNEGKE